MSCVNKTEEDPRLLALLVAWPLSVGASPLKSTGAAESVGGRCGWMWPAAITRRTDEGEGEK